MQTPHREAAGGFGPKTLLAKISTLVRNSYNLSRTPGAPETSTDPPENLFQTLFSQTSDFSRHFPSKFRRPLAYLEDCFLAELGMWDRRTECAVRYRRMAPFYVQTI